MGASIIQLQGSTVTEIWVSGDELTVRLAPAVVIKSEGIPRVDSSTRWTQTGNIVLFQTEAPVEMPVLPAVLGEHGSLECGGYRYLDMVPLPTQSEGFAELVLDLPGQGLSLRLTAAGVRVDMEGIAKYVEHL